MKGPLLSKKRLVIGGAAMILVAGLATWNHRRGLPTQIAPDMNGSESTAELGQPAPESKDVASVETAKTTAESAAPSASKEATEKTPLAAQDSAHSAGTAVTPEPDTCFTLTFKREKKESQSFIDNEEWANQRNLIRFPEKEGRDLASISQKSVCVRINGTAVKHEWTKKGILIGPHAAPGAKITVRYCVGREQCAEECKIPKDDFMAALGTEEDSGAKKGAKKGTGGRWTASAGDAGDVTQSVEAEMARELADQSDLVVFDGWAEQGAERPACGRKVASH